MNTYIFILALYVTLLLWRSTEVYARNSKNSFNVMDYGAIGDGSKDDSEAFVKAWNATCKEKIESVILQIPKDKIFMFKPMILQGPCTSPSVTIQVSGQIVAPNNLSDYPKPTPKSLLYFTGVDGLTVNGGGSFDARGQTWWNLCDGNTCPRRPSTAAFIKCNNLTLENLGFVNSSGNHISIGSCVGVKVSKLLIQAPENSPNTDGIDISYSSQIFINNCTMATGDDCIAITNESHNIDITDVTCGPGHGISIGSLGKRGGTDTIEEIHVSNCTFIGTQNGARIKTWQGGKGYARKISFEQIVFQNASNPVFIDQFYCAGSKCENQTSAVNISDVTFKDLSGTSASKLGIVLHCSETVACTNITLNQVNITSAIPGQDTSADCLNVHSQTTDIISPTINCAKRTATDLFN